MSILAILWAWASGDKVRIVIPYLHKSSPKHIYIYIYIYIYVCVCVCVCID